MLAAIPSRPLTVAQKHWLYFRLRFGCRAASNAQPLSEALLDGVCGRNNSIVARPGLHRSNLVGAMSSRTRHRMKSRMVAVDRYKLALFSISIGVIPLFYISTWLGLAALTAIYSLAARFANKDFDRQSRKSASSETSRIDDVR